MKHNAAKILWKRSAETKGLRYTTFLGDGDSTALDSLNEMQVNAPKVTIAKEECVNHVKKRMTTALKNLLERRKAAGKSISGRGKQTNDLVKQLSK
jgi:hypothetical protein